MSRSNHYGVIAALAARLAIHRLAPAWRPSTFRCWRLCKPILVLALVMLAEPLYADIRGADGTKPHAHFDTPNPAHQSELEDSINRLAGADLKQLQGLITALEQQPKTPADAQKVLAVYQTLADGALYYRKSDQKLFRASRNAGADFTIYALFTGEKVDAQTPKKTIRKVKTTNKIRKQLGLAIAKLRLQSPSIAARLASIQSIIHHLDAQNLTLLKAARRHESQPKVIAKLDEAIALGGLYHGAESLRLKSLHALEGSLEPLVHSKILELTISDPSAQVTAKAEQVHTAIEAKVTFYGYLERIFFGLSLGSVLLLVAVGLAITFGVMGVINMAHGELIMLGAYTTYVTQLMMPNHIQYSLLVAIPAAFVVSGLFGIAMERGVIRFLKGRPLETLLATFGISLILQQLVRSVFSPLNRQVISPEFMSGALQINPVFSLTYNRLYIFAFSLLVFTLLQLCMHRTSLGLHVRAVSQNRDMARSMGIRSDRVDALTFGLGAGVAGLAGVALSQITNVGPNLGQAYIIDSFMVVVFGGVGNLWGTLVGAFTVGALNKFLEPAVGAVLASIIVLVCIILFIQKKPRGLFPQQGRGAQS